MPRQNRYERAVSALGNEPPLLANGHKGAPDRREVSARWLSGTFLTGVTSSVLMGVALFAALDGRQLLATPPEIAAPQELAGQSNGDASRKAARVAPTAPPAGPLDRRRMEVSTIQRVNDSDLVRTVPFVDVRMALAAGHKANRNYPAFNPLNVFAEGPDPGVGEHATGLIYGAKVESDVTLKTSDFPIETAVFEQRSDLTAAEAEAVVRSAGAVLTEGDVQVASLHYVDPQRFASSADTGAFAANYGVTIIQENVSIVEPSEEDNRRSFSDEIIPVRESGKISEIMELAGYQSEDAGTMSEALALLLKRDELEEGSVIRLGVEYNGEERNIVRASIYRDGDYIDGIAVDDRGQLAPSIRAPEFDERISSIFDNAAPRRRVRADLPSAYDAIYNAAFSYGLTSPLTGQLIKMLAAEVDFRSRIGPSDSLQVLFSNPDEENRATKNSELLYVKARFGNNERTYYRFRLPDGAVDYFDAEGRSARQFLLRNPVPNGKFRSGFGVRRHPITRIYKKHTGVDWSAPRGTPIISSGSGTVKKAGWAGGYGRQTIIQHANGYTTSYSHQAAFAKGIRPGARVRQGQIIGYVGSTGLSTGNHLHYELIVNGTKVDPMRVRLPTGRVLKDKELASFIRERDRIDALLAEGSDPIKVASNR